MFVGIGKMLCICLSELEKWYLGLSNSGGVLDISNVELPDRILRFLNLGDLFNLPVFGKKNKMVLRLLLADAEHVIESMKSGIKSVSYSAGIWKAKK